MFFPWRVVAFVSLVVLVVASLLLVVVVVAVTVPLSCYVHWALHLNLLPTYAGHELGHSSAVFSAIA